MHAVAPKAPAQADSPQPQTAVRKPAVHESSAQIPRWANLTLPLQFSLKVNTPGDEYEQEADRVAETIMRMPQPAVQRNTCACGKPLGPDGMCAECKKKQEQELQRKATGDAGETPAYAEAVSPMVHQVLQQPGRPLDNSTRAFMESRFGQDFGRVRVHTDTQAAELSDSFNAQAFTIGQNIFFGERMYSPGTFSGRRLLAHELVHTQQQSGASFNAGKGTALFVQRGGKKGPTTDPRSCGGWDCAPMGDCKKPDGKSAPTATPSTSWSLTVKLDLDVLKAEDISVAGEVGHAYVEFNESNGDKYTYGHYHNKTKSPEPVFTPKVPGCTAHPDKTHSNCVDMVITYPLSEAEYKKALGFAQSWCIASPPYHVLTNNCATFVSHVAGSAGKTLPVARGKVGGRISFNADNPNTLFEGFVSQADNATWRGRATGNFKGHYDASGSVVHFISFELKTDDKFAVGGEYSYTGSSGDVVHGKLTGQLIFNVDGTTKAVNPAVNFEWNEPGGSGRGIWTVGTTGDLKGTWGRGAADSGAGGWELTKVP
jgi:hypothetical protein